MDAVFPETHRGITMVSREEITSIIKESKRELRMLGTISFNLPWNDRDVDSVDLATLIFDKYNSTGSEYEISIVAESDPTLHSYALTSSLAGVGVGVPIATLEEIRQNATTRFREKFISKKAHGIEPSEDQYRQKLDALYAKRFVQNICKELSVRHYSYETIFGNKDGLIPGESVSDSDTFILGIIKKNFLQLAKAAFQDSEIVHFYLSEGDFFKLGKANADYMKTVDSHLRKVFQAVEDATEEKKVDTLFEYCDKGISINYIDPSSQASNQKSCTFSVDAKLLRTICVDCALKVLEAFDANNYELIRDYASKEAYKERSAYLSDISKSTETKQRLFIKQVFHPIPVQMLMVDGVYFAAISPLLKIEETEFLYIGDINLKAEEDTNRFAQFYDFVQYFKTYINSTYCTEETKKNNRKEVIYNYTSSHAVIGQMPRDSFYGSDNYKLVMWALVFDRKGRILIHRRANNAKDNQGLWDKSVGGHIAITDRDTISGAAREIAEELYNVEEEEQSHTKLTKFNDVKSDEIIYLGKWKEKRYPNFGSSLNLESNEFYLFSFESRMTEQPIDSMRILPNGTRIKAKCFVDLYFTITSKNFDLTELKNSKYLVLPPQIIKQCAKQKQLTSEMRQEIQRHNPNISLDDISDHFDVTPDLEYIINSPEWDSEITKFSIRVKEAFSQK